MSAELPVLVCKCVRLVESIRAHVLYVHCFRETGVWVAGVSGDGRVHPRGNEQGNEKRSL